MIGKNKTGEGIFTFPCIEKGKLTALIDNLDSCGKTRTSVFVSSKVSKTGKVLYVQCGGDDVYGLCKRYRGDSTNISVLDGYLTSDDNKLSELEERLDKEEFDLLVIDSLCMYAPTNEETFQYLHNLARKHDMAILYTEPDHVKYPESIQNADRVLRVSCVSHTVRRIECVRAKDDMLHYSFCYQV